MPEIPALSAPYAAAAACEWRLVRRGALRSVPLLTLLGCGLSEFVLQPEGGYEKPGDGPGLSGEILVVPELLAPTVNGIIAMP